MIDGTAAASTRNALARGGSRIAALVASRLAAFGDWMQRHPKPIQAMQWCVVGAYALLVVAPAFLPLPPDDAHWYNSLVVLAQWLFWGIWWPFVLSRGDIDRGG